MKKVNVAQWAAADGFITTLLNARVSSVRLAMVARMHS